MAGLREDLHSAKMTRFRRKLLLALLVAVAGGSCRRSPTPRRSPLGSMSLAGPAPSDDQASMDDRQLAVIKLLAGGPGAMELPVVDHDPDKQWNPTLRDKVAPSVSAVPAVRIGAITVDGALDADIAGRGIHQRFQGIRRCYLIGLREHDDLEGTVTGTLTVSADGGVGQPSIGKDSTLVDPGVTTCMQQELSQAQFSSHAGHRDREVGHSIRTTS